MARLIGLVPLVLAAAQTAAPPAERDAQAEQALRKALADGDDSAATHGELGLLLYRSGRFPEAVLELGRAAQLDPDSADYSLKLASAILADKRYLVALELLKALKPRFERFAEYQYDLGLAYYNVRDYRHARAAFERAIELAPRMDLAYFFLANTHAVTGALERSLPLYHKAIEMSPRNAGYCLALGKVLGQIGPKKNAEAIRWLRRALELRPGDAPAEFALALACTRTGDLACARPLLEDVVARHPDELSPHVALARVYARLNQAERARSEREIVARLQREQQKKQTERNPEPGSPALPERP